MLTQGPMGQKPEFQDAVVQRAMSLYGQGQLNSADLLFASVTEEGRFKPLVREMRGLIARRLGFRDQARALLREAVAADPTVASAHANLGFLLLEDSHFGEALAAFAAALALKPDMPTAHFGLAQALAGLGFRDLAIGADRDAVAADADFLEAELHLGVLLTEAGRGVEAADRLRAALARHPDHVPLQGALAACLLTVGEWPAAWRELDRHWDDPHHGMDPQLAGSPRWRGEDPAGRTILLQAERNDGDTLLFCRYAPLVKAKGARVLLRCPAVLAPLLASLAGIDQVVAADRPLPAFDLTAPLLSLPAIFATQPESVPAEVPYLRADADAIEAWRTRLGSFAGLTVGIAWGDGDIVALRPLLDCPGVRFVSLDGTAGDSRLMPAGRQDAGLAGNAALIAGLDLVIAVDGPLAHVAGALGKPTWILLPVGSDWRWLRDRADTPWYPRARLFRQRIPGVWDDVVARVCRVLRAGAAADEPPPVAEAGPPLPVREGQVVADALFAEGTRHHRAGASRRAGTFYLRALSIAPDHAETLCNLGALEQTQGGRIHARQVLERAIQLAPRSAPAHRAFGDLLRTQGAFEEAAVHYRMALDAAPLDDGAHAGLAMTLRLLADYQGAMVHFQRAVEIERGQSAAFFLDLGQTLVALDRLPGAEVSLLHAIALDADLLAAHCVLGQLYLKSGRPAEAAAGFRRALAIDAGCILAKNGLAEAEEEPTAGEETA